MIDEARLHDFIGKMLGDLAGASSVTMVCVTTSLRP